MKIPKGVAVPELTQTKAYQMIQKIIAFDSKISDLSGLIKFLIESD